MESGYFENDPYSAPQITHAAAATQNTNTHSNPHPQLAYLPPHDQNEKYTTFAGSHGLDEKQVAVPVAAAIPHGHGQAPINDNAVTPNPKRRKRWMWILGGLVVLVLIVVAAVVGGVVGRRTASHKSASLAEDNSSSSSTSISSTSTATSTSTSSTTPTKTTTTAASATTSTSDIVGFVMWGGDECAGSATIEKIKSNVSETCIPVPDNKRSLQVSNNASCIVQTWSDKNCESNPFHVQNTSCIHILYAAMSVTC